jgi:putative CocE/NonD family hydrolase
MSALLGRVRVHGLALLLLAVFAAPLARAGNFDFRPPPAPADASTAEIMRDLAVRVLPVYQHPDPQQFLANVSGLQMAARNYTAATATRRTLNERRRGPAAQPTATERVLDLYARARATEGEQRQPFAKAASDAYAAVMNGLDDPQAYAVTAWLGEPVEASRDALQAAFDQQRNRDSISQEQAVQLIWTYLAFDAHRSLQPLAATLMAEEEARRYVSEPAMLLKTRDGGAVTVVVVRPRSPGKPLPTLFEFNIDPTRNFARECAAHGYAGVVAYARGRLLSRQPTVPYETDGDDARAVIAWIVKQPWSDGRVGMYGDRYSGFTAWAAAKRPPAALRAIATASPTAPGIDAPMSGGIVQNSAYRWSLYVTNTNEAERSSFYDDGLWRSLDQQWYRSGRRYRDLGRLHGRPNPIFIRWLNHPSYDAYWQSMIPYRNQFARVDMPVLTISGYFAGSQPAALYYFNEHRRYNPRADHTLLIGPYDDAAPQRGALRELQGYQVDASAMIDLKDLRYRWFDHVFKGGPAPAQLKDHVNYQVMGADEWRGAADVRAMAGERMRLYLDPARFSAESYRPPRAAFIRQSVDLKDRSDAAWVAPTDFISRSLAARNGLVFVSEPFSAPTRFSGLFSGSLEVTVNKMDMDLNVSLFELTPSGDYVQLYNPTFELRASYAQDRSTRHLLQAGVRQRIGFRSERLTSRQFEAGSRLVMLLGLGKRPDREINYGTGNDVSEESLEDADEPYRIRWHSGSYIDIPASR